MDYITDYDNVSDGFHDLKWRWEMENQNPAHFSQETQNSLNAYDAH